MDARQKAKEVAGEYGESKSQWLLWLLPLILKVCLSLALRKIVAREELSLMEGSCEARLMRMMVYGYFYLTWRLV
jgi:hypothetical protein